MDTSTTLESSKRQKVCGGPSNNITGDRISLLPESIVHYILSFLPMKKVVVTSVLSRSWKFHWKFVHNLDFQDHLAYSTKKEPLRKKAFFDFVDRIFCFNGIPNIHKFSLTCQECDAAHFNEWISNAVRRRVQELIVYISKYHPCVFPCHFFACQSLSILKLTMETIVNIPLLICLSSLKVLHLRNISFVTDQTIQGTTLSFPVLEEFVLSSCTWVRTNTVNISVPMLRRLTVGDWRSGYLRNCVIKINAHSLLSLMLETHLSYEYSLCHLSSLVDVVIDISVLYGVPDDIVLHRMGLLLKAIHNVRDLELDPAAIECVSRPEFATHVRSLSRLVHLRIGCGISVSVKKWIDLLCNMPNVELLFFPYGIDTFCFKRNGPILGTMPPCFLSQLKSVDIKRFQGIQDEQWFIKFLAKSVTTVDNFTVKLGYPREDRDKHTIKELEMLVKGSKCVLEYV